MITSSCCRHGLMDLILRADLEAGEEVEVLLIDFVITHPYC